MRLSLLETTPFPEAKRLIPLLAGNKPASMLLLLSEYTRLEEFEFIRELIILDSLEIYGSDIVILFYNIANGDPEVFDKLITQLSIDKATITKTKNAIKRGGRKS